MRYKLAILTFFLAIANLYLRIMTFSLAIVSLYYTILWKKNLKSILSKTFILLQQDLWINSWYVQSWLRRYPSQWKTLWVSRKATYYYHYYYNEVMLNMRDFITASYWMKPITDLFFKRRLPIKERPSISFFCFVIIGDYLKLSEIRFKIKSCTNWWCSDSVDLGCAVWF